MLVDCLNSQIFEVAAVFGDDLGAVGHGTRFGASSRSIGVVLNLSAIA